ncbi:MAG: HD domain-containing protein [Oscillospiraceae bacterium]|nr:HD domain-containing protein [Oscillospiraceae bacterium]
MIYTALTKKAMQIAYAAHHGQTDKTGVPYIFHPMHLAEQMEDEYSACAALLHDVVEDTELTFSDLEAEGFPAEVIEALMLLTHDPAVPYLDYVKAVRPNPIARAVKLADLHHNSDLTRLDTVDERALQRVEKYAKAIAILTEE